MTLQPGKQTFEIQILRNIPRSKGNQIIKSTTRSLIIFKKWISKKSFSLAVDEYIIIKEIGCHLSRFLKND